MANESYLCREIRAVRKAILDLEQGAQSATISSQAGSHSYTRGDLAQLEAREQTLLKRFSISKLRKRTAPSFEAGELETLPTS